TEAREMLGVRSEIRNARADRAARTFHQSGQARTSPRAWRIQHQAQSLLDQVLELAPAQRRLRLCAAVELVGDFNRGLHRIAPSSCKTIIMQNCPPRKLVFRSAPLQTAYGRRVRGTHTRRSLRARRGFALAALVQRASSFSPSRMSAAASAPPPALRAAPPIAASARRGPCPRLPAART